jgi:ribosomal protein S1
MGSGGAFVHVGGADGAVDLGDFHHVEDFVGVGDVVLGEVLKEDAFGLLGTDFEVAF